MEKWARVAALVLQHAPISAVIEVLTSEVELVWPSCESQTNLVRYVFKMKYHGSNDLLFEKYPPSTNYINALLKQLYENIEKSYKSFGPEEEYDIFADEFVETVMKWKVINSSTLTEAEDDVAYFTFFAPSTYDSIYHINRYVHIKVLRANNQVGARVWKASYYLTDLLLARPDLAGGKKVLELGSGVGNAMLTIAACVDESAGLIMERADDSRTNRVGSSLANSTHRPLSPRSIIMTDFDHTVLRLLQHNTDLNPSAQYDAPSHRPRDCPVHVRRIDWCTLTNVYADELNHVIREKYSEYTTGMNIDTVTDIDICEDTDNTPSDSSSSSVTTVDPVDLVLAADCTYSEDINVALVGSIEKLLAQSVALRKGNPVSVETNGCPSNREYIDVSTIDLNQTGDRISTLPPCLSQYPYALVVATQRQEATLQHFIDTVTARSPALCLEEVTQPLADVVRASRNKAAGSSYLYYDDSDIRVFCIRPGLC